MIDKLTKKRVKKVDYRLIIKVAGLESKFSDYLFVRRSNISMRRLALAFLRSENVDIPYIWNLIQEKHISSNAELMEEYISIAKYNAWKD